MADQKPETSDQDDSQGDQFEMDDNRQNVIRNLITLNQTLETSHQNKIVSSN